MSFSRAVLERAQTAPVLSRSSHSRRRGTSPVRRTPREDTSGAQRSRTEPIAPPPAPRLSSSASRRRAPTAPSADARSRTEVVRVPPQKTPGRESHGSRSSRNRRCRSPVPQPGGRTEKRRGAPPEPAPVPELHVPAALRVPAEQQTDDTTPRNTLSTIPSEEDSLTCSARSMLPPAGILAPGRAEGGARVRSRSVRWNDDHDIITLERSERDRLDAAVLNYGIAHDPDCPARATCLSGYAACPSCGGGQQQEPRALWVKTDGAPTSGIGLSFDDYLLIRRVRANSPADAAGFKKGMRIVGVCGTSVRSLQEYDEALSYAEHPDTFQVMVDDPTSPTEPEGEKVS
eukprot:TRINITY_DN1331_c1_g3_i1.p1 TRINITY_DN1331_c1_g3~~TRINITY_DN1331_c1_g3_i1.p1  ORF type:complete len:345 (+),score=68.62 TRINITY_DN1331_c1_g3_i1:67-1101(+)